MRKYFWRLKNGDPESSLFNWVPAIVYAVLDAGGNDNLQFHAIKSLSTSGFGLDGNVKK